MKKLTEFLLSTPALYSSYQRFARGKKTTQMFVDTYIQPKPNQKILDIGCGPGDLLKYIHDVTYCGFDMDNKYIEYAKKNYGNRGHFFCKKVSRDAITGDNIFDTVVAMGVIHHLEDHEVQDLFDISIHLLKPGGRLITHDGCYMSNMSFFEKLILDMDRGSYVRSELDYKRLVKSGFSEVKTTVRYDLMRIPQATIVMECTK